MLFRSVSQSRYKTGDRGNAGRVIGYYSVDETGRFEQLEDKLKRDFRKSLEFVMRIKPYSESDLLKKDFLTYFDILHDAEEDERKSIERMNKQATD